MWLLDNGSFQLTIVVILFCKLLHPDFCNILINKIIIEQKKNFYCFRAFGNLMKPMHKSEILPQRKLA